MNYTKRAAFAVANTITGVVVMFARNVDVKTINNGQRL